MSELASELCNNQIQFAAAAAALVVVVVLPDGRTTATAMVSAGRQVISWLQIN